MILRCYALHGNRVLSLIELYIGSCCTLSVLVYICVCVCGCGCVGVNGINGCMLSVLSDVFGISCTGWQV